MNSANTSVVGALKYASQYNLDKDVAEAFVIGRKALGFKEKLPRNYKKLLSDAEFLDFVLKRLEEEKQKTQERLRVEKNQYKKKPLQRKEIELNKQIKTIQSFCSELQSQEAVNPSLKPILISGDWSKVVRRLASVFWDRGYGVGKYRQLGLYPHLNEAGYKYPSPKCGFSHFG